MKNTHSFFSWNGNNLDWPTYTKWIVYFIIALLLLMIFLFRDKLRNWNKREPKIFNSKKSFYRWIGIVGIIYMMVKESLYIAGGYPLQWEHLQLHICRIHFIVMMIFFIVGKPKLIMYTTFISTMGALSAIYFGNMSAEHIANDAPLKANLFLKHNIEFYNVGPDNYFFYDFFIFHISIILIPIYLWVVNEWRMSTVNKYRMMIVYLIGITTIWTFNVISKSFPIEWKSNNWYIGPDEHNDYNSALGWLSGWPQNLFSYLIIGIVLIELFTILTISLYKNRSEEKEKAIEQYNNQLIKRIFDKKDDGYNNKSKN